MNMGKSRLGSAGSGRVGSAGSGDSRMLKNTVSHLQHELMQAKAETQKVNDQLNCLINLVKRAWTGDKSASIHVANIVGIAPPDFDDHQPQNMQVALTTKPKSRALNNWAVMTIGLLNKEYRAVERQVEIKQQQFLHMRQAYLEEQMLYHRDLQAKMEYEAMKKVIHRSNPPQQTHATRPKSGVHGAKTSLLRRSNSHGDLSSPTEPHTRNGHENGYSHYKNTREAFLTQPPPSPQPEMAVSRTPSGQIIKKPPRQLYRPQSGKQEGSKVTLGDLFTGPVGNKANTSTHQTLDGLYRLPPSQIEPKRDPSIHNHHDQYMYDPDYMSYDDPRRYSNHTVFDVESALGADAFAKRTRPTSAVDQRHSDKLRSRPKSSTFGGSMGELNVYPRGERPLKYETTRPVSGKSTKSGTNSRPNSSKVKGKGKKAQKVPNPEEEEEELQEEQTEEDRLSDEFLDEPPPPPTTPGYFDMKINIDKPQSVIEYDDEVLRMTQMEKDFKRTAIDLQRKLGIGKGGMIC